MESVVVIDGCKNKKFPTLEKGQSYFNKKHKQYKGKRKLMALYKNVDGKFIGVKQN